MADSKNIKRTRQALEDAILHARLIADCLTAAADGRGPGEPPWIYLFSTIVDQVETAANDLIEATNRGGL